MDQDKIYKLRNPIIRHMSPDSLVWEIDGCTKKLYVIKDPYVERYWAITCFQDCMFTTFDTLKEALDYLIEDNNKWVDSYLRSMDK